MANLFNMKHVGAVANAFLDKSNEISLLKLLKLCYIAQGFSLAILDRPIFNSDSIEAWKNGPVIPSLYHEFKYFGGTPIRKKSVIINFDKNFDTEIPELKDEDDKKIIDIVWNMYGHYSANDLATMTYRRGTPWDMTYISEVNRVISNDRIQKYYKILVTKMMDSK